MMLMAASNNEAASVAIKLLPAPSGRGVKAGSGLHELLFTLLGQDRVEWDAKLRAKLKHLLLKDVAEREQTQLTMAALHDTIRSVEMDRRRAETDKKVESENSNQVEELGEEKPEIDVADENPPALEPIALKAGKEEALRAPSPTATRRPSTSSTSNAPTRRRSSVRRKSLTLVSCKSSPGKVSMSPGKHGCANQLVLVKAKKSSNTKSARSSGDAPSRLGIKIARKWKPLNFSLFSFHPNAAAVPTPVLELGPQQNAIMLRQLRYVKGVMHELPWAKSRLRDMLSHYTQKDLTKEDLFPQLSHLSVQVQDDLDAKAKAQKHVIEAKAKQATTLQLAKGIINELTIMKYGRRGKPHETKLYYDETHPCVLYWQSKQGDRSSSFLPLHGVKAIEVGHVTPVFKRAARKHADLDATRCLSLVTDDRTLDLRLPNTLQRDWLLKALQDAVQYAVQYRATAPAKRSQGPHLLTPATPRLRRM